jgi:acyl-coenzyme A thioesterase PaaI-like protein
MSGHSQTRSALTAQALRHLTDLWRLRLQVSLREQSAAPRSGQALSESMGNLHVTGRDPERRVVAAPCTLRREYCHTRDSIAQGGFINAWLDVAMAHAVVQDTDHKPTAFSLQINISFCEKGWAKDGTKAGQCGAASGSCFSPPRCATSTGLLAGLWSSESRPRATASGVLRPHRRWIRRSVPDRCGTDVQPQRLQAHPADPGAARVLP